MKFTTFSFTASLLFFCTFLSAQSTWVDQMEDLLTTETIDEADKEINAYYKQHPDDADALMMMGELTYNRYFLKMPDSSLTGNPDEDIYTTEDGEDAYNSVLPAAIAEKAITYYQGALKKDPERTDMHFSIAYMYSASLQLEKLLNYLPILAANMEDSASAPYDLEEYSYDFLARRDTAGCFAVYEKIQSMYPDNGGVMSDEASQYYSMGYVTKAMEMIDEALQKKEVDATTYAIAFYFFGVREQYDRARDAYHQEGMLEGVNDFMVYNAFLDMLNNKSGYKRTLENYLSSNPENDQLKKAATIITSDSFSNSLDDYKKLNDLGLNDAMTMVVHNYFSKQFPDAYLPSFNYAEDLTYNLSFAKAAKIFSGMKTEGLTDKEREDLQFYESWCYYKNGESEKAVPLWTALMKSENFYYVSAGSYFLGKYYRSKGDEKKAGEYFSKVAARADESKYAFLAKQMLAQK